MSTSQPIGSQLSLPPLSLYIHIPWCVRKCPYCDFNSHESNSQEALPEAAYLDSLKLDLAQEIETEDRLQGRKLRSIFFGGGTPSLFSANSIASILNAAEKTIGFEKNIEITLEANPGTFEQQKFYDFYHAGINRLSIGIQSFQETQLKKLGRIHNRDEAKQAALIARKAGFNNINLDLMHGLPQQTVDDALSDLNTAIALEPEHISWYQLTIEPNTVFYRQPPPLPVDDILADIQETGLQQLDKYDYKQYEVSAFSQPEKPSRHNLNYWQFGDYIGIGAGAHGKWTDTNHQRIIRRQKTRLPEHYMNKGLLAKYKESTVNKNELPLEFLMNALRLTNGVPVQYFQERTGLPLSVIQAALDRLISQGLLEKPSKYLKTTQLGQQFLNTVLTQLMET
ncbi:MAG: radical SAM family heme chaperone HemW [Cellvibrionaceae bacterium]